jgi:hypothetical protein
MSVATSTFIKNLIGSQLRWTDVGTNHDIYDNRLTRATPWPEFQYVPRRIYFYYVSFDSSNAPTVDHYLYDNKDPGGQWTPINESDLPALVSKLANNAAGPRSDPAPDPLSKNFKDIVWRHKSWIVILIDEEGWNFHKRTPFQTAAAFNVDKGSTPNHSFFDAVDLSVSFDGKTRSAIAFINHMKKDADGNDLQGNDDQIFLFDAFVDVMYRGSTDWLPVILDPGGTNQGPPLEP